MKEYEKLALDASTFERKGTKYCIKHMEHGFKLGFEKASQMAVMRAIQTEDVDLIEDLSRLGLKEV